MNGLGFLLMGLGLAGAIWCAMNAWESWQLLRARKIRLVKLRPWFTLRLVVKRPAVSRAPDSSRGLRLVVSNFHERNVS